MAKITTEFIIYEGCKISPTTIRQPADISWSRNDSDGDEVLLSSAILAFTHELAN